ncbi:MAG: type II toxin-antitoxin system HicA family toxin [bacterium]
MSRVPRDVSGRELVKGLRKLGYEPTRQVGSHIRLATQTHGEHHITVPDHDPIPVGTLTGILGDVAAHFEVTRDELLDLLFA